jgi:hypothetical protein
MNKTRQAIEVSIAHWERMIAWAKMEPEEEPPAEGYMRARLGENWYSYSCALCKMFGHPSQAGICGSVSCPLALMGQKCSDDGSCWESVSEAATWREWISHARRMLGLLRDCLAEKESAM